MRSVDKVEEAQSTFAPVMNFGISPDPPCRIVFVIPSNPSSIVSCMSDIVVVDVVLKIVLAQLITMHIGSCICAYHTTTCVRGVYNWGGCCSWWITLGRYNEIRNISSSPYASSSIRCFVC